jgi:Holliday junction resolvase
MRKYAARTDDNHTEIINAFRSCGFSVQDLSAAGDGIPDLLIGRRGKNYLIEVKDGNKPPSKRKLTQKQLDWHDAWLGQVEIIESVSDVMRFIEGLE